MKNSKILGIAAALSMGFAACSDDAQVNAPDNSQEGVTKYMSVVIKNVGDNSRALPGDSDFEGPATGSNESDITKDNIRFYFFTDKGSPFIMSTVNVNGTVTKTNMVAPTAISQINNTNGAAATFNGVLVLGLPDTENGGYEGNLPAKVVAIVNPRHADGFDYYAQKTLNQLYQESVQLENLDFTAFTMVSSSYVDGEDKEIYWTDVTDNIKDTQAAAEAAPAQIFLERLAAKVRVKGLGEYTVQERDATGNLADKTFRIWENADAPTETKLNVTLDGWKLLNRANHTYAIKHIADFIANPPYEDWNDPTRHRSYWAYTAATGTDDFYYGSFDFEETNWLGNFDTAKPTENILYTYGNTAFARGDDTDVTSATDRTTLATAIIVKAFVKKAGETDPIDLVKWGPEYYSLDYFKQVVISAWNNDRGSTLTADAVGLKYVANNLYVATVTVNGTANDYERFSDISYWDGGKTSYLANVKHYAAQNDTKKDLYGVVRNHIYDYTFNSVVGLGVPGTDPVNPEDPDQNYLAAVVNCLNWHVVSYNDVTLGE